MLYRTISPSGHRAYKLTKREWIDSYDKEGKQWLSICHELNLNAFGKTRKALKECKKEAEELLIDELLDEYSRNLKWSRSRRK